MRVALTGVSGFIGSNIARHLHQAGHKVTGLVRASSRRDHLQPYVDRLVVGEQAEEAAWADLLKGADCIIHNSVDWKSIKQGDVDTHLRSNLLGSIRLLEASAPRQFIFMSTIAVHHDMRPRWSGAIDEDHPLRPSGLYGAYKAAVEAHLWAAHFGSGRNTSALRPCAVYGVDPAIERSYGFPWIERLRRGETVNKPGGGKFVHVDDVAAAAVAIVGNPHAAGSPYNLADCYARWNDLVKMLAEIMEVEVKVDLSSPPQSKNVFSKEAAKSLGVPLDRGHEGLREYLRELVIAMNRLTDRTATADVADRRR